MIYKHFIQYGRFPMKKIYVILYLILICAFLLTSCAAEQDQKSQYLPPATAKSEVITDTSESITENDADIQTKEIYSETGAEYTKYIANKTSKIFHCFDCRTLPAIKNRIEFSSRDEAISTGYLPCGNCNP